MQRVVLERHEQSDHGTFGRIVTGDLVLFTGELPWRENAPNISCIPEGYYRAAFTHSPRFGRGLYLVSPVLQRTGIRIHPANLMGDASLGFKCQLNGCIALGEKLGWIEDQKAVLLSASAVRKFETYMGHRPFELEVIR